MKLAYVTPYVSEDIHAWSGSVYFVRRAMAGAGMRIFPIDDLREHGRISGKLKELGYKHFAGKRYIRNREDKVLDGYARQVEAALEDIRPDAVLSPGTVPIAHVKTDLPLAFWTDATFAGLTDFYPLFTNLCKRSAEAGRRMEQEALRRCSLAIYTSDWAAKSAIDNYDVDPAKVKVVPYGANMASKLEADDIDGHLSHKSYTCCKLLFLGVDWERKGGAVALEAARVLNGLGLRTELHVVGCEPPGPVPDFVVRHGFVSKETKAGVALLDKLLTEAHFLIVPSRAECYGLVYAEASSYALPSLAAEVGGVPTVVKNGVNGRLFPLAARGEEYAEFIGGLMGSRDNYEQLCRSSFTEFKKRLNWGVAGAEVAGLLRGLVE